MKWTPCADCGSPCGLLSTGWYRCRQCGFESLRELAPARYEPSTDDARSGADPAPYDRHEAAYIRASIAEETRVRSGGEAAGALGLSLYSTSDK